MDLLEQLSRGIETHSADEMRALGREFAKYVPEDWALALLGDLGSGKTTFAQGLGEGFRVRGEVSSPSFNVLLTYRGERNLIHFDAYRLESGDRLDMILVDEVFESPYCFVVEWPEKVKAILPADTWYLEFSINRGDKAHWVKMRKNL